MKSILCSIVLSAGLLLTGPAVAATVPMELDSGRPMVQLMVNGKGPYPFVFDTGAPDVLVMSSLVEELGLPVVGRTELQSPAGGEPVPADIVRVTSIGLGEATVAGRPASVLDMDGHGLGRGVIGPAVFRELGPVALDFERNFVVIGNEASPAADATWLPFGESAPLLDVPVRIGDASIPGHLDTGNPGLLSVPSSWETRLPLAGPVRVIGRARTIDREFELRAAPIEGAARVGDAEIPLEQLMFNDLPVANLGTAALRGLVLYIDWETERFALTGTARPDAPMTRRVARAAAGGGDPGGHGARQVVGNAPGSNGPRFGIRARPSPDGTIQVVGTESGSPAEALGLASGDRIVAINGKPTAGLDPTQVRAELAMDGLELTVERDGKTLRLKRPS